MDRNFLNNLKAAVLANTSRPTEDEEMNIIVQKNIMTSLKLEGDSKMGMILFIGCAHGRHKPTDIMDYLGIEFSEEYAHKLSEFSRYINEPDTKLGERKATGEPIYGNRTKNKVKLINNYLNLN